MSYQDQMQAWLLDHPNATPKECYMAGYDQCTENWCKQTINNINPQKTNHK